MISWTRIILAGLSIVGSLISWAKGRSYMRVGEDKIIAQAALEVLAATDEGKRLRNKIKALDDKEADQLWDDIINA